MTPFASGPLSGLRIVELASEIAPWAGKLFGDMGADVILVEPPGGHPTRNFGPFADDVPDPDRSLWFWYYNTSKRSVCLDLDQGAGRERLRKLISEADIILEGERPGRLASLSLDYAAIRPLNPRLIMISVTPFGQTGPRVDEEVTDLTLLAGGGPVWMCGYDDHTLPPVRGGGNQGYHTASHFAVMSGLSALVYRDKTGTGQHINVNAHAAANVTTEGGSYNWLVARQTVQRQTGRHAGVQPSQSTQILCADGRYVSTGLGVRRPEQFRMLLEWLSVAGLVGTFPSRAILEWAVEEPILDPFSQEDDTLAKLGAAREAIGHLAANMPAYEFFQGGQKRNMQVSIIYSPEEVLSDPHMVARGFPVSVNHPELGRDVTYPGAPYLFHKSPVRIQRRPPLVGEHSEEVFNEWFPSSAL
jgi:crotonobetainyl-CoA:carnitine CoA-transferase CaiB-like acyl-CoA transferase